MPYLSGEPPFLNSSGPDQNIKKFMAKKEIHFKLNGQAAACAPGDTIMQAAKKNGLSIPGLCGHPDFPAKTNCRVCVVEIKGRPKLEPSCAILVEEGMEITTDSARVRQERNLNLELIFAEHIEKCPTCVWRFECPLLFYAEKYKIKINRFSDRKGQRQKYSFANAVELDGSQCIDCRNCVDACSLLQKIDYLEVSGKGVNQEIKPVARSGAYCILCGQCALHCPVSAAQEQSEWPLVERDLADPDKIMVAQIAPSVRVTVGEDFDLPYGRNVAEKIISGLRRLGFKYVFDVNFGADITTIVEAEELLDRLAAKKNLPMFTSCCPGWVNYVEFYEPRLIPNMTTVRSPHIHSGGIIKTYWARRMNIKPENIVVVSVMPCTAKKYEAKRPELRIKDLAPVDHVLTARELSFLFKKNDLDLKTLPKDQPDALLGDYSGGAALFGGSGGVMESALRAAAFSLCQKGQAKICRTRIDFEEVRGLSGVKSATVELGGHRLRVGVVNGIGNIRAVLDHLADFDYLEVMACPGGCIGGGGQPIPTTPEIRRKRIEAILKIDQGAKIRRSNENQNAILALDWLKENKNLYNQIIFTKLVSRI